MIFKNKVDNEPVLSNVGQIGEFRIRNSAKAFGILSSGLYANKIRAIVREYSCNAVDSHIEAGRADTPFDVHLPNTLEPWFAIRDYGVGLDEQQVRNIFTTYFESTKTETDDLIGGLGLGSKSAFSYTDNFTIVAIKNGMKRVYTAFINDQGVPSIAPMGEEESEEPTGVEIRFAVEDSYDFRKFQNEAQHVYKHFKLRPIVSGGIGEFTFTDPEYSDRDVIPGVHTSPDTRYSYAIMGNIEYPLDIPNNMDLGDVGHLLRCGLVIEFNIGELDIQASREGLSYIPETVAAIKAKLEAVNNVLVDKVANEVNAIENKWEKAYALKKKQDSYLWAPAVKQYVTATKFDLLTGDSYYRDSKKLVIPEKHLAETYNLVIRGFTRYNSYGSTSNSTIGRENVYDHSTREYYKACSISVSPDTKFVVNDTKVGCQERAKHHWINKGDSKDLVYVLDKADKTKDMKVDEFFASISNPPEHQICLASSLIKKERKAGLGKAVSILVLEQRDKCGYLNSYDMVWRDAGALSTFDDKVTYYYLPLSGFNPIGLEQCDVKTLARAIQDSDMLNNPVYGVRKGDLDAIKSKPNWVNVNDYLITALAKPDMIYLKGVIREAIDFNRFYKPYVYTEVPASITNPDSPYLKLYEEFVSVTPVNRTVYSAVQILCSIYQVNVGGIALKDEIAVYDKKMNEVKNRYPLLIDLHSSGRIDAISEYVNAIDLLKGV
jgi:hypothetical protein